MESIGWYNGVFVLHIVWLMTFCVTIFALNIAISLLTTLTMPAYMICYYCQMSALMCLCWGREVMWSERRQERSCKYKHCLLWLTVVKIVITKNIQLFLFHSGQYLSFIGAGSVWTQLSYSVTLTSHVALQYVVRLILIQWEEQAVHRLLTHMD